MDRMSLIGDVALSSQLEWLATLVTGACALAVAIGVSLAAWALLRIAACMEDARRQAAAETIESRRHSALPADEHARRCGLTAEEVVAAIKAGRLNGFMRDGRWYVTGA